MAKNKISEWSSTAANNTDVGGIDIAEGCAPSGINNAIREVMAQVKDMITGADGDSQVVGGNLSVTGTSTLTGAVTASAGVTGNLTGNVTGNLTGASTGAHNGTVGATTPATVVGTTITANSGFVGNLTGNVTGNASGLSATLAASSGGTGASSLTANSVLLGNGTSAVQTVAPSTSGNLLTSNGTTWTSAAPAGAIGVGQTWQDVSASRALTTSYTNSTGKPIQVSVNARSSTGAYIQASVGGVTLIGSDNGGTTGPRMFISFVVPNSVSYSITFSAGSLVSGSLQWAELR